MKYDTTLKLIGDAEAVVTNQPLQHNPAALEEVRRLAQEILAALPGNSAIDQKCSSLLEYAEIAYAPRSRERNTREEAQFYASADLHGMRVIIRQLQHAKRP